MSDDPFETFREMADAHPGHAVTDPRRYYGTPANVVADPALSDDAKRDMLMVWAAVLDDRLKAEDEGMSASDPMNHTHEAALADEAAQVGAALRTLDQPPRTRT